MSFAVKGSESTSTPCVVKSGHISHTHRQISLAQCKPETDVPGQYMSTETSGSDTGRSTGMSCLAKLCSTRSVRLWGWPCSSPASEVLSKTRLLWCCSSLTKPRAAPTMSELYSNCTPATLNCKQRQHWCDIGSIGQQSQKIAGLTVAEMYSSCSPATHNCKAQSEARVRSWQH